jgi:hypothetical protein
VSGHPLGTVAALKRALTPGVAIHIENHFRPVATRDTVVHPKTNTVDLVTEAPGAPRGSHLRWPKAADLRPFEGDDRRVHIDKDGTPFLTITIKEAS